MFRFQAHMVNWWQDLSDSSQRRVMRVMVLTFYTLVTLIVTWPVISLLSDGVAGYAQADQLQKVWTLWYTKEALLRFSNPAFFTTLAYPYGYFSPIRWSMLVIHVMAFPLTLIFPPIVAYNLVFLLSTVFTGYAGYLLCLDITNDRKGAIVGGLVIMLFPTRIGNALAGHLEASSLFLALLYMRSLRRSLLTTSWRQAVHAGLIFAVASMVHITHSPYVLLPWTGLYLLYFMLFRVTPSNRRSVWRNLLVSAVTAAIIMAPFFIPMALFALEPSGLLAGTGKIKFSADLLSYVSPAPTQPILRALNLIPDFALQTLIPHPQEKLAYLGIIPLGFSALALIRRFPESRAWLLTVIAMMILGLGPHLKIAGEPVLYSLEGVTSNIVLPYAIFSELPLFEVGRTPGRFNLVTGIGLGVLTAQGASIWLAQKKGHTAQGRVYGLIIAGFLLIGEYQIMWPVEIHQTPIPAPVQRLAQESPQGGLLNLPLGDRYVKHLAAYYQITHGWPNMDGYVSRILPNEPGLLETFEWMTGVAARADIIPAVDPDVARGLLRDKHVSYVLLHREFVDDEEVETWQERMLGRPLAEDESTVLYRVEWAPLADELAYALYGGWLGRSITSGEVGRWLSQEAGLVIVAPEEMIGSLSFIALSGDRPRHITVNTDSGEAATLLITEHMRYYLPEIRLHPGYNLVHLEVKEGCWHVLGDPVCSLNSSLSGLPPTRDCDLSFTETQCVDILIQEIQFMPSEEITDYQPLKIQVGDSIRLLGYSLKNDRPEELGLMLAWQALDTLPEDYHFFVHLLDAENGELVAQHDGPPLRNAYGTSQWSSGDIVQDRITLGGIPSGSYVLLAGIYRYPSLERLDVRADRMFAQDDLIWLQNITIDKH